MVRTVSQVPDAPPGMEAKVPQAQASAHGDRAVDRKAFKSRCGGCFCPEAPVAERQEGRIFRRCNACTRYTTHDSLDYTWQAFRLSPKAQPLRSST